MVMSRVGGEVSVQKHTGMSLCVCSDGYFAVLGSLICPFIPPVNEDLHFVVSVCCHKK